jgi:hypothetical protein
LNPRTLTRRAVATIALVVPLLLLVPSAASAHGEHVQVTEIRTYTDTSGSWQELVVDTGPLSWRWCRWHAFEQDILETRYLTRHVENGVIVQQEQTGLETAPLGPPRTSVSGLYQC